MSRKYLGYLLLALTVAVAGCLYLSHPAAPVKHLGEYGEPTISIPSLLPTAEPMPTQPPVASQPDLRPFDLTRARWLEYKLTQYYDGQPSTSTVKLEYSSGSANGATTQNVKKTVTTTGASSVNVMGQGSLFSMSSSSTQSSSSSGTLLPFQQIKSQDPVLSAADVAGSPEGSETVTVPDGTYDCKKYLGSFKGSDATYWEAPGVPVPVKVYTACDGATLELVDWG